MDTAGRLVRILLRPSARTPLRDVPSAIAIAGQGLDGDHAGGGTRQVTLLDLDGWRAACSELGTTVDPSARRANLIIDGLDLTESRGRRLRIGDVALTIRGRTAPCELLDTAQPGLAAALRPDWRAGAHAEIDSGGELRVGAPVRWADE